MTSTEHKQYRAEVQKPDGVWLPVDYEFGDDGWVYSKAHAEYHLKEWRYVFTDCPAARIQSRFICAAITVHEETR